MLLSHDILISLSSSRLLPKAVERRLLQEIGDHPLWTWGYSVDIWEDEDFTHTPFMSPEEALKDAVNMIKERFERRVREHLDDYVSIMKVKKSIFILDPPRKFVYAKPSDIEEQINYYIDVWSGGQEITKIK